MYVRIWATMWEQFSLLIHLTSLWSLCALQSFNVSIVSPTQSPGVVLGNPQRPMAGVLFDNVTVSPADPTKRPWKDEFYHCAGVDGVDACALFWE